jgi:hypothetical protein
MKIFRVALPLIVSLIWIGISSPVNLQSTGVETIIPQLNLPTPTYDPLATPALPENPTDFDLGKYLYYFHCMPCHGDLGQGLTDEFRSVWVEDHQNCWGRGCHGGRQMDEGFPIPTIVPMVISNQDGLPQFKDFEALQTYLHDTHPPQYPGKLKDEEYRQLSVYLWQSNAKPRLTETPIATPTLLASATSATTPTIEPSSTPGAVKNLAPLPAQPSKSQPSHDFDSPAVLLIAGGILLTILLLIRSKLYHQERSR